MRIGENDFWESGILVQWNEGFGLSIVLVFACGISSYTGVT